VTAITSRCDGCAGCTDCDGAKSKMAASAPRGLDPCNDSSGANGAFALAAVSIAWRVAGDSPGFRRVSLRAMFSLVRRAYDFY